MTYLKRSPARPILRRRTGLSGLLDPITDGLGLPSQEAQCLAQANAQIAPFDAQIDDLVKNWNPSGFYTPADIRTVVSKALATVQQGQAAVNRAAAEPNASQDSVMRATDDLGRAGERSLAYLQAATQAEQQGLRVVNAPGLKRWATDTMAAASSALVTAATIGCITPWWADALSAFQAVFDVAWSVIGRIAGTVIQVGETVLKVAEDLPEIWTILKWGAVAYGALYLWVNHLSPTRHHH